MRGKIRATSPESAPIPGMIERRPKSLRLETVCPCICATHIGAVIIESESCFATFSFISALGVVFPNKIGNP